MYRGAVIGLCMHPGLHLQTTASAACNFSARTLSTTLESHHLFCRHHRNNRHDHVEFHLRWVWTEVLQLIAARPIVVSLVQFV
jgi:hypothetical protein